MAALRVWGTAPVEGSKVFRVLGDATDAARSRGRAPAGRAAAVALAALAAQTADPTAPYRWAQRVAGLLDACGGRHVAYRSETRPWGGWWAELAGTSTGEIRAAACGDRATSGAARVLAAPPPPEVVDPALDARIVSVPGADLGAWRLAFELADGSALPLDDVLATVAAAA